MIELDELLYDALCDDDDMMTATGGRIKSTCFEVSPLETDNTPLPYIIVMDNGLSNTTTTKDDEWKASELSVQAAVEIGGRSPKEVKQLCRKAISVIASYVTDKADEGDEVPYLISMQTNGIVWDWTKPCYFTQIFYNCTIDNE